MSRNLVEIFPVAIPQLGTVGPTTLKKLNKNASYGGLTLIKVSIFLSITRGIRKYHTCGIEALPSEAGTPNLVENVFALGLTFWITNSLISLRSRFCYLILVDPLMKKGCYM